MILPFLLSVALISTVESRPGYNSWPMIQSIGKRLVCTYSVGVAHDPLEAVRSTWAKWSDDEGKSWNGPHLIADDPVCGETPIGKGLDSKGAALFWVRSYSDGKKYHVLYRTTDGIKFERISVPELSPMPMQITDIVHVPGRGLVSLWFAGNYHEHDSKKSWGELVSADDGKTWKQRTIENNLSKSQWATEQSFVRLPDGRLLGIARSERYSPGDALQWQLESKDNGYTWTKSATNIRDVMASTPSLIYDPETDLLHNYYYERGKSMLKRRVVHPDDIWGKPLSWPEPEVVAYGSDSAWDSGNACATHIGKRHHIAYYTGKAPNTSVVVASIDAQKSATKTIKKFGANAAETYLLDNWSFTKDGRTQTVRIPHDWAISGPFNRTNDSQFVQVWNDGETEPHTREGRTGGLPVVGTGVYERKITVPKDARYASLVFDGVMDLSRIFVDGKLLAERKNGYAIFEVPFPATAGEHTVRVEATVEPMASRWYQGAGLYRPVRLITGGAIGIKTHGIYARTTSLVNGTARIAVRTDLRVPPEELAKIKETETVLKDENELPAIGGRLYVRHTLLDRNGEKVGGVEKAPVSMARTDACFDVARPRLWSPEDPYLYTLVTEVVREGRVYDSNRTKIGVRTISFAADGFRLNGIVRKFKGVNLHHDLGPLGAAFNKSAFRRQVRLLKGMGVDSIRTAHNFPPPWQTQICDELGMMVMAESLDEWLRPKQVNGYWRNFAKWWEKDFTDSYSAVINSPSIVMWSIGNEVHDQRRETGYKAASAMIDLCHRLDPSRPVAAGLSWVNNSIESGLLSLFDVPSYTYHLHRYEDIVANSPYPFIVGAESSNTISSRGIYHFPVPREPMTYFSEKSGYPKADHQVTGYDMVGGSSWIDKAFAAADDNDWVLGGFIWTGIDYLGEPTPYQTWPSHASYYGPIDLAGLPKDRFYLHRANWLSTSPTLHILPHWTWPGREGKTTPVFVYTSWPEAELFVNGVSQGRRRKDPKSVADRYRLRWFDVVYEPGEIRVVAFDQSGNPVQDCVVKTAGAPARIVLEQDRSALLALSPQDTPDLGYVTVKVVDAQGTLCPHASDLVRVKATGAVSFKCIANGDSTCLEPFTRPQMHLFSGMLAATVEAGEKPGEGSLEVSIEGLPAARVGFNVFADSGND